MYWFLTFTSDDLVELFANIYGLLHFIVWIISFLEKYGGHRCPQTKAKDCTSIVKNWFDSIKNEFVIFGHRNFFFIFFFANLIVDLLVNPVKIGFLVYLETQGLYHLKVSFFKFTVIVKYRQHLKIF